MISNEKSRRIISSFCTKPLCWHRWSHLLDRHTTCERCWWRAVIIKRLRLFSFLFCRKRKNQKQLILKNNHKKIFFKKKIRNWIHKNFIVFSVSHWEWDTHNGKYIHSLKTPNIKLDERTAQQALALGPHCTIECVLLMTLATLSFPPATPPLS